MGECTGKLRRRTRSRAANHQWRHAVHANEATNSHIVARPTIIDGLALAGTIMTRSDLHRFTTVWTLRCSFRSGRNLHGQAECEAKDSKETGQAHLLGISENYLGNKSASLCSLSRRSGFHGVICMTVHPADTNALSFSIRSKCARATPCTRGIHLVHFV